MTEPTADTMPTTSLVLRGQNIKPHTYPLIMGIVNVTPDSFSDGGQFKDSESAVNHAAALVAEGADIIDFGPESTRPGAATVCANTQLERVIPVISRFRDADPVTPVSIDTRWAAVADAAIENGADMINDVSALRDDPDMVTVACERNVPVVLMHRKGTPIDMQRAGGPSYDDVVAEVSAFWNERMNDVVSAGVDAHNIILDPGIGFGKRVEDNLTLLGGLEGLHELRRPIMIGASRKRFLGSIAGETEPHRCDDPRRRLPGSLASALWAAMAGAAIIRVHDVGDTSRAIGTWCKIHQAHRAGCGS
ncbi:MAG: dihydropteroate synthase [Planctomycetota bacterium]|jgi:dihydropteroate synthase